MADNQSVMQSVLMPIEFDSEIILINNLIIEIINNSISIQSVSIPNEYEIEYDNE